MSAHGGICRRNKHPGQNDSEVIERYRTLQKKCFDNKHDGVRSREAFDQTTELLTLNPDFYSVWNYRRALLPLMHTELSLELAWLTQRIMPLAPKSYWVWNHRVWCLQSEVLGSANWHAELQLVERVLEADPRNFHAWNYRRLVLPHVPTTNEYVYTLKMISQGIANASAWHHRSTYPIKDLDEEIMLVRKAVFTEPEDPPAWLYYRWLFAQPELVDNTSRQLQEIETLEELEEMEPNCKWLLGFLVQLYTRPKQLPQYRSKAQACIERLKEIDSDRQEYYVSLLP